MKITLPKRAIDSEQVVIDNVNSIVIVGGNGAGKSLFGEEILRYYNDTTFKISALNSSCNEATACHSTFGSSISRVFAERFSSVKSSTESEFEQLFKILLREELDKLIIYKRNLSENKKCEMPVSIFDKVQAAWEEIFPNSKLIRHVNRLEISSTNCDNPYNVMAMSHGEKIVFFLIASAFLAPENSIVVVDEPEMHLHPSMTISLWDYIEGQRKDCTFIYLTHDLNFAVSRTGKKIWVKRYFAAKGVFDYDIIENSDNLPEEIFLELLGGRKPVLFIEGNSASSIDSRLYPLVFPNFTVKAIGGCSKVIEVTRAFSEMKSFHLLESRGIVDRDRRTKNEIAYLKAKNIYVPNVAEVENFFMLEDIIRVVAKRKRRNADRVFNEIKGRIIQYFTSNKGEQALLHTRHRVRRQIEYSIDIKVTSISEFSNHITNLTTNIDPNVTYQKLSSLFGRFISEGNYVEILKYFNQKSMLNYSKITKLCGFASTEKYINFVIEILKEDSRDANIIRNAIRQCFDIDEFQQN